MLRRPQPTKGRVEPTTLVGYQCWTWSGFRIAIQPDPAIQNRIGLDFKKIVTGSDMDIQTALNTAVECLIKVCFRYKPDWIKYLDSATELGSYWITQWKYWSGLGSQKTSIRSTLPDIQPANRIVEAFGLWFFWDRTQSCFTHFKSKSKPDPVPIRFKQSDSCLSPVNISHANNQQRFFSKHKIQIQSETITRKKISHRVLLGAAGDRCQVEMARSKFFQARTAHSLQRPAH